MKSEQMRVLCVDDHPLILEGITAALQREQDIKVVAEATNGVEAIEAFRRHLPDVTIMDFKMPRMNGIVATEAILAEFPQARIVMLTSYAGDVNALRAFRSGVKSYLLKSMKKNELIETMRRVHAGQSHIPAEIAQAIASFFFADTLSFREQQVLRSVAKGKSNKAVANELRITEDTVKGHVRNILAKLQANDRTHAVLIAMERGYIDD